MSEIIDSRRAAGFLSSEAELELHQLHFDLVLVVRDSCRALGIPADDRGAIIRALHELRAQMRHAARRADA